MQYFLSANGTEAEISISPRGIGAVSTSLRLDGPTQERRFLLTPGAALERQEDGSYRRHALLLGAQSRSQSSFFLCGRPRVVDRVGGIGGRVESLQSEGTVGAPMNGQVVKIVKEVGDRLEAGEIVLILEAMKMENEVTAPLAGLLKELLVEPGQNVGPGQLLFTVEAAE